MIYIEKQQDLFEVNDSYCLAHCISRDCKMGAGIAVEFQNRFFLRENLLSQKRSNPDCVRVGRVFNLITKEKYWHKPTLETLKGSLEAMRDLAVAQRVKRIAMPRIGSGLDKLSWNDVRRILIEVFDGTNIEIFVCTQ